VTWAAFSDQGSPEWRRQVTGSHAGADSRLGCQTIAERLSERLAGVYADITAAAVASQLRARGVTVKNAHGSGGSGAGTAVLVVLALVAAAAVAGPVVHAATEVLDVLLIVVAVLAGAGYHWPGGPAHMAGTP
jgi:hypothetical protein